MTCFLRRWRVARKDAEVRKPDFLIVGAPRSGTTTLFRVLADSPGVFGARSKEVHYFDLHYDRGPSWYASQFEGAPAGSLTFEATPLYLSSERAMERIVADLPGVPLIAILRDPAARAHSHFYYRRARGLDSGSFSDALRREIDGEPGAFPYLAIGDYVKQLRFLDNLRHSGRIALLRYDALRQNPIEISESIEQAISVRIAAEKFSGTRVNAADSFRSVRFRQLSKRLPSPARRLAGRLNRVAVAYPPPTAGETETMVAYFRESIEELAQRTGWPLELWLPPN